LQIDGDVSLSSGASLTTQTFGIGNSGIVLVQAGGNVSLTGSNTGIFSTVEEGAIGSTIGIDIEARSLSMNGGANLQALTRGEGNAGIILVNASDFVSLSGVSPDGFSTGLFTSTEDRATGIGGFIEVNTGSLRLSDGAVLSARTRNAFTGGDIVVNVNTLDATNGGQILTTAFSTGRAGNITVIAANSITLSGRDPTFTDRFNQTVANLGPVLAPQVFDNVAPGSSGLFANTSADSNAEGGDINVSTRDLFIRNGAQVSVNNQGSGSAGNLQIKASRDIQLRNQGSITAETRSGGGGNITLDVGGFLLLLRNSEISTTAGTANAGGNGGDIIINTHSDIIAAPANNRPLAKVAAGVL
jgi:large exoprotein involved in heme utilization and adhesion